MLLPALKEMVRSMAYFSDVDDTNARQTKDFVKFLGLVGILYLGKTTSS